MSLGQPSWPPNAGISGGGREIVEFSEMLLAPQVFCSLFIYVDVIYYGYVYSWMGERLYFVSCSVFCILCLFGCF